MARNCGAPGVFGRYQNSLLCETNVAGMTCIHRSSERGLNIPISLYIKVCLSISTMQFTKSLQHNLSQI